MHRLGAFALLSLPRRMRVLVAISILAFLALLWASIAIFRHIRRAHRRRRRFLESSQGNLNPVAPDRIVIAPPVAALQDVPEITFTDPEAPIPEVTFTDPEARLPEPASAAQPAFQPFLRQAEAHPLATQPPTRLDLTPEPESKATQNEFQDTLPPPPPEPRNTSQSPLPPWPHFGFTPSRSTSSTDSTEPLPYAAPPVTESSAAVTPDRTPLEIQPPAPAVKPLYPPLNQQQPEAAPPPRPMPQRAGQLPLRRIDLAYFNKDMGDLSDPVPAHSRPKTRSTSSK